MNQFYEIDTNPINYSEPCKKPPYPVTIMNITEQTNALIATFEKSIADKEKQLNDLSWEIKVEKVKLKKLKKALEQPEKQ